LLALDFLLIRIQTSCQWEEITPQVSALLKGHLVQYLDLSLNSWPLLESLCLTLHKEMAVQDYDVCMHAAQKCGLFENPVNIMRALSIVLTAAKRTCNAIIT